MGFRYGKSKQLVNNNTHYPFVYMTAFYAAGIGVYKLGEAGPMGSVDPLGTAILTCVCVWLSWCLSRRARWAAFFLLVSVAGLGCLMAQNRYTLAPDHIRFAARYYRQKPVTVRGMISSGVESKQALNSTKTIFTMDLQAVRAPWGWETRSGKILVHVYSEPALHYGDVLELSGKLHAPYNFSGDDGFSYRNYLAHRNIFYILSIGKHGIVRVLKRDQGNGLRARALAARGYLTAILDAHLTPNESGIMRAVLLGDRSRMVKPIRDLFARTGTAHILAISGLHISVVAGLFLIGVRFLPLGQRMHCAVVLLLLIGYAFLTGGRPSVMRATIMMVVLLFGFVAEKEPKGINSLFCAAWGILLYNPFNLFDVGFQLSFACVGSILLVNRYAPKPTVRSGVNPRTKQEALVADRWRQFIRDSIKISCAVWIGVAGLIAYYFRMITPVTIIANVLVVPLISVVVALGFGLLITGMLLPSWAALVAVCLKASLNLMVGIIILCDKIPLANFMVRDVKIWHIGVYYGMLALFLFLISKKGLIGILFFRKFKRSAVIDKLPRV